jgi:hypothetical protein
MRATGAGGREGVAEKVEERSRVVSKRKVDWGKLNVEALNRATSDPVFSAKYKAWLEYLGPNLWTPVAKADYEKMCTEDIDPELVAKYRAELGTTTVSPVKEKADDEPMLDEAAEQPKSEKQS